MQVCLSCLTFLRILQVDFVGDTSQKNYWRKTFLGDEWWGEVDGIKHCEKRLPLKCHSFGERSNFPRIWFRDLRFRTWGLEINHLNAHSFVWQGLFFFHYYLATSMTDWAQTLTGLLFYAYVEMHQLWRLV